MINKPIPISLPWKKDVVQTPTVIEDKPIYLHSTMIKAITDIHGDEKPEMCPKQVYHYYIAKDYKRVRSEYMMWGTLLEQKLLGHSAYDDDDEPLETPKHKRTGEKLITEKRIEEQVMRLQSHIFPSNQIAFTPYINTQVKVYRRFNEKYIVKVIYDIFPSTIVKPNESGELQLYLTIFDLKGTGDVNSTWGDFCWGSPEYMDHLQADLYLWASEEIDFDLNDKLNKGNHLRELYNDFVMQAVKGNNMRFHYIVVGYVKEPLINQISIKERTRFENSSDLRRKEMIERVKRTITILEDMAENNYPARPHYSTCKNCVVSKLNGGTCEAYSNVQNV